MFHAYFEQHEGKLSYGSMTEPMNLYVYIFNELDSKFSSLNFIETVNVQKCKWDFCFLIMRKCIFCYQKNDTANNR